jgi:hypothetical protein
MPARWHSVSMAPAPSTVGTFGAIAAPHNGAAIVRHGAMQHSPYGTELVQCNKSSAMMECRYASYTLVQCFYH